jgi:hypothetical protein|tara:strand:+ start:2766 stop:3614 length:849 start_codon:yes stop_codon:yes gene_type:complete
MARFSRGKRALMISMRSGAAFPYREMVQEWTGAWVHNSEFEPKQPQLTPQPVGADPQALQHANPARTEFATVDFLSNDPFSNLNVGFDAYILVHQRGNQLVNGDYVRFRDVKTGIGTYPIVEVEQETTLTNDITATDTTINLTLTGWVDNLSTSYPAPGFVIIEKINPTTGFYENEVISFTGVTGNSTAGSLTGCVRGTASPFRGVTPRATVASAHAAGTKVFGSRPITLIPTTFVDAANTTITETNSFQALVVAGINWGSADGTLVGGGFQCTYGPLNDRS